MSQVESQSSSFIESTLKATLNQMLEYEQKGDYSEAEKCRLKIQKGKKDLQEKQITQMQDRHKRQNRDMKRAQEQELRHMNEYWEEKIRNFLNQGDRLLDQMQIKHQQDCKKSKASLEGQLSMKVKESPELLNLRKMEEQMAKQKNYAQAHLIQEKIKKLFAYETQQWMEQRQQKISTSLSNLKTKQASEHNNLQKRIKTGEQEQRMDWHLEQNQLNQKYDHLGKELKALQQREIISFKGQFKSKGGSSVVRAAKLVK